jgi:Aldehyde dehydrogenase family
LANDTEFGLASYFYSRDIGRVWRVAESLESGMVGINTGLLSTEVAPFGRNRIFSICYEILSLVTCLPWKLAVGGLFCLLQKNPVRLEQREGNQADGSRYCHEQGIADLPLDQHDQAGYRDQRGKPIPDRDLTQQHTGS